jgi:hypothetical protein
MDQVNQNCGVYCAKFSNPPAKSKHLKHHLEKIQGCERLTASRFNKNADTNNFSKQYLKANLLNGPILLLFIGFVQ